MPRWVVETIAAVAAVVVVVEWRRRRARSVPRTLAIYESNVTDRPWYKEITVCELTKGLHEVTRQLHLGNGGTIPESIVAMKRDGFGCEWLPIAARLMKPHLHYSLLAFAWLHKGFEPPADEPGGCARAALIGVAGGSLLHFWTECVPGGRESLAVDAVELDGAVLRAARDHLGLRRLDDRVTFHETDGAAFLRDAEDEVYDLLVVDLDIGALVPADTAHAGAPPSAPQGRKAALPSRDDPTRDMYRVLSSRGVLVINEYSEEAPSKRLESTLRLVRLLRRFFPEVHQLRTTTHHNTMLIAAVSPDARACRSTEELVSRAARCSAELGLGGIDLGALVEGLPPNRHQVYHA